jgi:hypothetical protein
MNTAGDYPDFDIEASALPWTCPTPQSKKSATSGHYLRGPIPWSWLKAAIELGSGALTAGLAIWHLRTLRKTTTFAASLNQLSKWTEQSEKVMREGLHRLERARLVAVERPVGRSPIITILEAPSPVDSRD